MQTGRSLQTEWLYLETSSNDSIFRGFHHLRCTANLLRDVVIEASTPASPFATDITPTDAGSEDVTPITSHGGSSATSNSPVSSPERNDNDDPAKPLFGVTNFEREQPMDVAVDPQITPAPRRDAFSPADGVDPFGLLPIKINEHLHAALQHALQIYPYSGNNYKLAFIPQHLRASMNQFPITQVVHQSVYQEHHIYSLLATISCRMAGVFGRPMNGMTPAMYRQKATHSLRMELSRNAHSGNLDKHTILDILFLCVSEMWYKDYESAYSHLAVVGKLYHVLDTNQHFDFWISETAAHIDNQLALATGRRPVLPYDFDPGPLLPERMAALKRELKYLVESGPAKSCHLPSPTKLAVPSAPLGLKDAIADLAATLDFRMGTKFEWGLKIGVFSGRMGQIVQNLVDCVAIAKVVWLSPHAVCFDAEWLCRKARAVMRALLAAAPENTIGPQGLLGKCMEAARMSLLIMMSHACTMLGFQFARTNVVRLQKAMAFALSQWCEVVGLTQECAKQPGADIAEFSLIQLEFILFSIMVGVWSAAEAPEIEEWFLVRAVNICRIHGIHNYSDLQQHQVSFLLSKTLQDASIRKVAALLEQW